MAKKKLQEVAPEPEKVEVATDTQEVAPEPAAPEVSKTSFDVYTRDGGYVRTYSIELHGENAEALAKQYAGKLGGSVK
jgi:hypothetical protein